MEIRIPTEKMKYKSTEIPASDVTGPMLKMARHNINAKYKGEGIFKLHCVTLL
jgi:hypothetical protein